MPGMNRTVWAIAGPAMLTNVSVAMIGLVDAWVAGQLGGAAPLAAVAAGTTVLNSLFWSLNFLRMGTTALTAQAVGARDAGEVRLALLRAALLALVLGFALALASSWILAAAVPLLGVTDDVQDLTLHYAAIRLSAAPLLLLNMALVGWLMGQGRARLTLVIELVYNGANTLLSLGLGLWLGWGIGGIAAASVAAELVKTILCLVIAAREGVFAQRPPIAQLRARAAWSRVLVFNRDLFLRVLLLMTCLFFFTRASALMGVAVLAANHIVMQLNQMQIMLMDGYESAAQVLGGQRAGARDRQGFDAVMRTALRQSLLLAVVLAALLALVGPVLAQQFSSDPAVVAHASQVWPWLSLLPLLGFACFTGDGLFIGAGWTRSMLASMAAGALAFGLTLTLAAPWGVQVPWLALAAMLLARALTLGALLPMSLRQTFGGKQ
jgi:multidrug resistance protein, MATE family